MSDVPIPTFEVEIWIHDEIGIQIDAREWACPRRALRWIFDALTNPAPWNREIREAVSLSRDKIYRLFHEAIQRGDLRLEMRTGLYTLDVDTKLDFRTRRELTLARFPGYSEATYYRHVSKWPPLRQRSGWR